MKKVVYFGGGIVLILVAYWLISPLWKVEEKSESLPVSGLTPTSVLSQASFKPESHDVLGRAAFLQSGDKLILRFEDFLTVNGPDLRVYLSTDLEAKDFIDLGPIRATKGSVNYELPPGTDITKYKKVLVWCRAFNVLFSYAEL